MMLKGNWPAATRMQANAADKKGIPDDKLGWFAFPTSRRQGRPADTLGGINGWLVTKGSPKEAVEFLKFFTDAREPARGGRARLLHPGGQRRHQDAISQPVPAHASPRTSARSKYHQIFYDQMLGPSVGAVVNDVSADIAAGRDDAEGRGQAGPAGLAAGQLTAAAAHGAACRSSAATTVAAHTRCSRAGGVALERASGRRSVAQLAVVLLFLPPALLLFTLFVALPMGEAGLVQLLSAGTATARPSEFVGLRNYELLFENRAFRTALVNNLLIIVVSLLIQLPLALGMALLLADASAAPTAFRMIFFLPYVLAEIAAGLIWRFVYDGDYGLLAQDLRRASAPPRRTCWPTRDLRDVRDPGRDRLEVLRLPHDAVHRRAAADRPEPLRGGAHRRRHAPGRCFAASRCRCSADDPAVGVLRDPRLVPAVRPDHAAHQGRPVGQHADHGDATCTTTASRACASASAARSASCCSSSAWPSRSATSRHA